jgi:hypothetical protein
MANRDIKYYGRDFEGIKQGLIEFTKAYYPESYTDFNEASPGSLFIDLAAYVGDVLGYYIDSNLKESLLLYAQERRNLLNIANAIGYKPKLSVPAMVDLDIYQLMPAMGVGAASEPNTAYALKIKRGMEVRSTGTSATTFTIQKTVDFSVNTVQDPIEFSVYSIDNGTGDPTYYLAKKQARAISGRLISTTVDIGAAERFTKFLLVNGEGAPIIGVDSIVDGDGFIWYEVPYLAQDTIFEQFENRATVDPDAAIYSAETPYLLRYRKEIQFGAGLGTSPDEELLATPEQIGLALPTGKENTDASIDPNSPLLTAAYGLAPSNTTLTVNYFVGGGVQANAPSNTITEISAIDLTESNLPAGTPALNNTIRQSVVVNNPSAATGGRNEETNEEIRQNTLAQFASQNRAVTREDYIIRCYSMPSIYGSCAKAFVTPDEQNNLATSDVGDRVANPLALNLYTLGYDNNKNCIPLNAAIKSNLKAYIDRYRMLTDSLNIRDAFVINIKVLFDIVPLPNYNSNDVLLRCIARLKDFFDIDRWQINQPIIHSEVLMALLEVKGVQTASNVRISNVSSEGYSNVSYDTGRATVNGITYPSLDPAIFEVKYPDIDIEGRVTAY